MYEQTDDLDMQLETGGGATNSVEYYSSIKALEHWHQAQLESVHKKSVHHDQLTNLEV